MAANSPPAAVVKFTEKAKPDLPAATAAPEKPLYVRTKAPEWLRPRWRRRSFPAVPGRLGAGFEIQQLARARGHRSRSSGRCSAIRSTGKAERPGHRLERAYLARARRHRLRMAALVGIRSASMLGRFKSLRHGGAIISILKPVSPLPGAHRLDGVQGGEPGAST